MTPAETTSASLRMGDQNWLLVVLLIPALCAFVQSYVTPRVQAGVVGPERTALAFDQFMVNFGEPHPRPIHEAQFHFENRSQRTVTVTKVEPSCGCLTPRLVGFSAAGQHEERKQFAPGEHGILAMGIRPAKEQPGEKSYTVAIHYDDGQPRSEVLEFRITLPKKKLTVEPNELYFYQLTGEPESRVVAVRDFRDQPAKVTGVEVVLSGQRATSHPFAGVSATLGEMTSDVDGETTWPIQVVVAPDQPSGRRDGWLVISTDDPEAPKIKLPVLVFGKEHAESGSPPSQSKTYGPVQRQATASESTRTE